MFKYILRLLILLPLIGGMAWGSLWLWKRVQMGVPLTGGAKQPRPVELVGVLPLVRGLKASGFDMFLDVTAVDWLGHPGLRFEVVWHFFATGDCQRLHDARHQRNLALKLHASRPSSR